MIERTISKHLAKALEAFPVIVITGARQVGKSTEVYKFTKTHNFKYVSLDDIERHVNQDLMNDLKTFGFLFETLCIRDLRVFADALNGSVYHYRDKDGLECDAVIHLRNGKYGLIEIKLGGDKLVEEGAKSLKAMEEKIDTDKMKAPSFLMVLTGTGDYAYRRHDGVYVIPIGCLKN